MLIRLQDNVPETYVNSSRDFQLLCRLYDTIINGVKVDTDSIMYTLDTKSCNSNILGLLQTKLGFFSNLQIANEDLRYVLRAFPIIVKNKGSLLAIKQAMNVFLRLNHLNTDVNISYVNNTGSNPYTLYIGVRSQVKDVSILNEIFKYILPTGYSVTYFFYENAPGDKKLIFHQIITSVGITNAESVSIRSSYNDYDNDDYNLMIGAVDTGEIASVTTPEKWQTPEISLNNSTVFTEIVDGVIKYKVYINGEYIGYIDENNQWHINWITPTQAGGTLTISQVSGATVEDDTITLT